MQIMKNRRTELLGMPVPIRNRGATRNGTLRKVSARDMSYHSLITYTTPIAFSN